MDEYMNKDKSIIDDLDLIGHLLSDVEIIAHTLNGLVDEFKELTTAICVRDTPITFKALYDKLLDDKLIKKRSNIKDNMSKIIS